jgi:hypothetical protein
MSMVDHRPVSGQWRWAGDERPSDDKARMFRIYGYQPDERPGYVIEPGVGQYGVGVTDPDEAEEAAREAREGRPDLVWIIEWRLL